MDTNDIFDIVTAVKQAQEFVDSTMSWGISFGVIFAIVTVLIWGRYVDNPAVFNLSKLGRYNYFAYTAYCIAVVTILCLGTYRMFNPSDAYYAQLQGLTCSDIANALIQDPTIEHFKLYNGMKTPNNKCDNADLTVALLKHPERQAAMDKENQLVHVLKRIKM